MASGEDAIAFSQVDTERFGVRVARALITPENLFRVMASCAAQTISLLIVRCATQNLSTVQKMEGLGFLLMDTLVYYSFDLVKRQIPSHSVDAQVRKFLPEDRVQIERVAAEAFAGYYGHYHADPKLDSRKCDEGYVSWAVRSCTSKEVATEVLVAERDHQIIGFATLRSNSPEEGEGVLFGVAPEAQGLGIYRAFMVNGMLWSSEKNAKRMVVSTQINNLAVQKVWCRLGFEPARSYYTFHKWF